MLDYDLTCRENLYIAGIFYGIKTGELKKRIDELLIFFNLSEKRNSSINSLSSGMKKKLAISRALIPDPDILMFDEPTVGLDPHSRYSIWDMLIALKKSGKTIILTTHYMDEAERLCDRVAIIDDGKIIADDTPSNLISKNLPPYTVEIKFLKKDDEILFSNVVRDGNFKWRKISGIGFLYYKEDIYDIELDMKRAGFSDIRIRKTSLEDVYIMTTGKTIRG